MSVRRQGWSFAGMGVLYVFLGFVGRATVVESSGVALVWPAAGVALLWLLAETERGRFARCLVALVVLTGVVMTLTGATFPLTVTATVAHCAQIVVAVVLLQRWCPGILGTGGTRSVHTAAEVGRGAVAVIAASVVGATIGGTGLALETGSAEAVVYLSWWARTLVGMVVVGAAGHLLWEQVREPNVGAFVGGRAAEAPLLLGASAATYAVVFTQPGLPLAFLVLPLSVWVGLRFATVLAALHTALFGSAAVVLTLVGRGPFGDLARPEYEAITMQAFLLTTMLTVLTIATGRDQRDVLAAELAASVRGANERAELLDAMAEAMTEGLAIVAADGTVVRMNGACQALLSHTPAGWVANSRDFELRRPDGGLIPPEEYPFARALREGQVPPHDVHLVLADGTVRVLAVNAGALKSGTAPGALVVFRDVTRERRDRSELAAFASTVAHDLRSPLTAIRGWLDLASSQLDDITGSSEQESSDGLDDVRRSISHADKSIVRMSQLIHDLLSQATAEGRELDATVLKLSGDGGLIEELLETLPHGIDVKVSDIPPVLADPELVSQLLSNLLDNAVKYADLDRPSRVTVTGERLIGRVRIDIADDGVGIPVDQRVLVFDRFHRAHAGDARFSGTGLGLALCRTIVERHGGVIECLPGANGTGTTMRFDLPTADRSEGHATVKRASEPFHEMPSTAHNRNS